MGMLDGLTISKVNGPETDPDSGIEFARDPVPNERPPRKAGRKAAPVPAARKPVTSVARLSREVAEDLATLIEVGATAWGLTDDCCAPVLEMQAKPIADALTSILARNPRVLMALAESDVAVLTIQVIALGKALTPVGKAVYHNHISKAVDDDSGDDRRPGAVNLGAFPAYSG